ncbi:MAG: hypothetical protein JXL97_03530 [Bacteroidales bacterium]|nr:hypothetical protein [Bacteroidales bacterium]
MNILITSSEIAQIPLKIEQKWNEKLIRVKSKPDKTSIILLGEILEILSNIEATFECKGVVEYDMFGGCDFSWNLFAGKYQISHRKNMEISESWQRVEEIDNHLNFSGLEEHSFYWNSKSGGLLYKMEIKIKNISEDQFNKILEIGNQLYSDFSIKII